MYCILYGKGQETGGCIDGKVREIIENIRCTFYPLIFQKGESRAAFLYYYLHYSVLCSFIPSYFYILKIMA